MKNFLIISGPNGAGKSTFAMSALKKHLKIDEFVNADEIAKGLSPLNPESADILAGRIMLKRIDQLISEGKNFSIETTLAGKNYQKLIKQAKNKGYIVTLIYLWLPSSKVAVRRVAKRVKQGGHNVPKNVIIRRYKSGLINLIELYEKLVDVAYIISGTKYLEPDLTKILIKTTSKSEEIVYNEDTLGKIIKKYNLFKSKR